MLRERCIIKDASLGKQGSRVLSNRLVVPVGSDTLVVRGQNMHSVARFGARLYNHFLKGGPLGQQKTIDYAKIWKEIEKGAYLTNPENWTTVYLNGEMMFASGDHHPFLDAIEQQVRSNDANYDVNVFMAGETLRAGGHPDMDIDHTSNVALIMNLNENLARCGLIYRHPRRTTTFSFTAAPNPNGATKARPLAKEVPAILEAAADLLESVQICYAIAAETAKGIEQNFETQAVMKERLAYLRSGLDGFESGPLVTYRPERPDMNRFLQEAQLLLARRARA